MPTLSFEAARASVLREVAHNRTVPAVESMALDACFGRILATAAMADRDLPALNRSVRDGFAVRSADLPGRLKIVGESRAGGTSSATVAPGEAVEIMTGAPVPEGADCIVMVEHVQREGDLVTVPNEAPSGQFISFRGEEARSGQPLLSAGQRIGYSQIAILASSGYARVDVYRKPRIAILPTGDELVPVEQDPKDHQIRNSNSHSLAAQVIRAGGTPYLLPAAVDNREETALSIERALASSELLLLSGGVSAGKYDVVEPVLAEMGAEFFFDRVAIQPGQPLVFGRVREKFFFGLPGNPGSTMVTFEVFGRLAVELLAGRSEADTTWPLGRLTRAFRHKTGLTRFLPGLLSGSGELTPLGWKGSSDMPALARANVFFVVAADREEWQAGETMPVVFQ